MKIQEKLEDKRNRNALVIAVITAFAVIVAALIPLFNNTPLPSKQKVEIKTNQNSPVSGDIQTQNNYFLHNSIDSNKRTNMVESTQSNIKAKRTFIIFPSNDGLEQMISKDNYILAKRDIRYSIEIAFSGQIEKVQNNLYRYDGGNILIKVNGETCSNLNELIITPTFNGGNNEQNVLNEINEKISELISQHTQTLYKKIVQCLK